jgi:endonuclease-8
MPEGDTVWLTARRLDQALAGRALTRFELRVPQLATIDRASDVVLAVLSRGKHLMIRLDSGFTLHSHLRMDGSWYLTAAGTRPRRYPEHLIRAQLGNVDWLATGYRVHDLRLVDSAAEDQLVGHLGPDLLSPDWDEVAVAEAVQRLLDQPERAVGEALLDQRALAGIGNLYKSEALFMERIDPWRPVSELSDLAGLVRRARQLLYANREHPEQSTTGLLARGQQHWVYERRGELCRRCREPIRRAEQGRPPYARSTYWCPRCQPASG